MLTTEDLCFSYDGKNLLSFPDLRCSKGEYWLLLGDSGSGKTTLLHLLAGLLKPTSGVVNIDNTALSALPAKESDHFRGKHIGIVFQKSHFIQSLNVEENLLLAQRLAGVRPDKKTVWQLLQRLNIGHKMHEKTSRLSQGEQQRVAIARAIINRPSLILADEPTSALDDTNAEEVIRILEEQASTVNATLIVVTHDGRLKEKFSHRIQL